MYHNKYGEEIQFARNKKTTCIFVYFENISSICLLVQINSTSTLKQEV